MPNKRITQLNQLDEIANEDLFAVVDLDGQETKKVTFDGLKQNLPGSTTGSTQNQYLVPTIITGSAGDRTALTSSIYENTGMFRLTWEGGNGIHQLILPDATSNTNAYRQIRFISDGTVTANDEFYLTCSLDQTLDGSSNEFQIDRSYEGIMVWSDGTEWFRIQTKA